MTDPAAGDVDRVVSTGVHEALPEQSREGIGWSRAILTGIAIAMIAFLGVVWLPDLLLSTLSSVGRDTRVLIAASVSMIMVIAMAWVLRRLQARGLI